VRAVPLWSVSLDTTAEAEEAVGALFESIFEQSPSFYFDAETGRLNATVFLRQPPKRPAVAAAFDEGLSHIRACGLNPGRSRLSVRRVRKQDWSESWKRHFKPFVVASQLLVKPSWSRRKPTRDQKMVVLDPGLSFGTGQHPTTRFCLEQLVKARDPQRQQSLLDAGTGSGILAIAAAKLGYAPVKAFDFDPAAVQIAKENSKKNRVSPRITRGDITRINPGATKYDVVCANLTADLLQNCAGKLRSFLKPRGLLVLAGVLRVQASSVRASFQRVGFSTVARQVAGEWESMGLALRKGFV
jgi:ribosomal protein L11 methyltransferase